VSLREVAELWAQTKQHKARVRQAMGIVGYAFETVPIWHVAFSGGKDSTVVMDLVRQVMAYDVPAVWSDDEWWLPETGEYMDRCRADGINLHQIRTNDSHAEFFQISGDWDGIQDYARQNGLGSVFLGLRAEESAARRLHLKSHGWLFESKQDGFWHCNPLHNWTWQDVWGYISSRDLDYNRAYDRLEEIGVPPERQRIGPLAVEKVLAYGQMAILKRGWPEVFNRFAEAHPEVLAYV
jgi:phosphoadenosine phosphosulfate reductase